MTRRLDYLSGLGVTCVWLQPFYVSPNRDNGYDVADERRDPHSLLNWTERVIRMRKECPEISWGNFAVLRANVPEVLAMRYDWRETSILTLHIFSNSEQKVRLRVGAPRDELLVEVFGPPQPATQRRPAPHHDGAVCLAVVPGRSPGHRPRSQ